MSQSGVRPEVLGNHKGNDGLRMKDLPEMSYSNGTVEFEKIPTMVIVRPELSKSRKQYITFLSEEGCDYLKGYLEGRMLSGEALGPDTDIITPKIGSKMFVCTINIGDGVRKAIRTAGFSWRPYVLRCYFDSQLLLAESRGLITHAYRQFFMGHVGDIDARYTTNKGRLTEEMLEDMRTAYSRSTKYLQTMKTTTNEDVIIRTVKKQILLLGGEEPESLDALDFDSISDEEILVRLENVLAGRITGNGTRQKMIPIVELEDYINKGWEWVTEVPGEKCVVKVP